MHCLSCLSVSATRSAVSPIARLLLRAQTLLLHWHRTARHPVTPSWSSGFSKFIAAGQVFALSYVRNPDTGLVPPATLSWIFASPRTGSLILRCLDWPCRKAFTRICTALHGSTDRYWSFSERDRNVIIANSLREYFGLAPLRI